MFKNKFKNIQPGLSFRNASTNEHKFLLERRAIWVHTVAMHYLSKCHPNSMMGLRHLLYIKILQILHLLGVEIKGYDYD